MNDDTVHGGHTPDAGGSPARDSEGVRRPRRRTRWQHIFPMLRCPFCKRYLIIDGEAWYRFYGASKKQVSEYEEKYGKLR